MILRSKKSDHSDNVSESLVDKHCKLIDQGKRSDNKYFYKISNLDQLSQIGKSYLEDYKRGVKHFAFSSTNYKSSQQKTVLGVASYFDHLYDMKILIVTDTLLKGVFEEIMNERTLDFFKSSDHDFNIEINRFYHHFDLVDINKVITDYRKSSLDLGFSFVMKAFLGNYDIVFWDTPIIDTNRNTSELFIHTMPFFESITFIVSPSVSRSGDVKSLQKYFSSYGINIKGIIFDAYETESNSNKGLRKVANR